MDLTWQKVVFYSVVVVSAVVAAVITGIPDIASIAVAPFIFEFINIIVVKNR